MTSQVGNIERNQPETFRARALNASLTVKDIEASVAWYRDVIGFHVGERYEPKGKLIAVSLKAGAISILLTQEDGSKGTDRVKGEGFSLQLTTTQNVDFLAQRIKAHGATLDTEPFDNPWGMRAFRLRDPDGFKLVISSEK